MTFFQLIRNSHNCPTYTNSCTDTEVYVTFKDNIMYVSFDSTDYEWIDWLYNFDVVPKRYRGHFFHRGFLEKWKCMEDNIIELITMHRPEKIVLAGHSQGGAVSGIGALVIKDIFPDIPVTLITTASPNYVLGFFKNKSWLHYTLRNDIVPRIPFIYKRVGKTVRYGNIGVSIEAHDISSYEDKIGDFEI